MTERLDLDRIEELEKEVAVLGKKLGKVSRECAARRVKTNEERAEKERQRALARERLRALVEMYVGQFLVDAEPFWRDVREDDVVDGRGRIDYGAVDARVRDLLARKPYLSRHDTP